MASNFHGNFFLQNFFRSIKEEEGFLGLNNRDWAEIKKQLIIYGCSAVISIFLIKIQAKLMQNMKSTNNSHEIQKKLLAHFRSLNKIPKGQCKIKNSCVISKRLFNRCKGRRKERSEIDQRENPKEKVIRKKTSLFLLFKVLKSLTSLKYDWS